MGVLAGEASPESVSIPARLHLCPLHDGCVHVINVPPLGWLDPRVTMPYWGLSVGWQRWWAGRLRWWSLHCHPRSASITPAKITLHTGASNKQCTGSMKGLKTSTEWSLFSADFESLLCLGRASETSVHLGYRYCHSLRPF